MPKLSVIVPVYNTEKYLRECVDSILAQTFTDFELILVDDGSTDGSGAICDEYAKQDDRVQVIHQENGGAVAARRKGSSQARGEYISVIDSDDWISQYMYQDMMTKAETYDADMILCDMVLEKQTGCTVIRSSQLSGLFTEEQLKRHIYGDMLFDFSENRPGLSLSLCNKLIRAPLAKYALAAVPVEITYGEDAAGTLICMLKAKCIYIMKDVAGYHYRQSAELVDRERSLSRLSRLSNFAKVMPMCLAKYGFVDDDQLAGYMAQISLFCIRQILLFNVDHTMSEKVSAVKNYLQEPHIRNLFLRAESLSVDQKMRKKLKLVNQNRYLFLLVLFTGKEMLMCLKRRMHGNRDKQ